LPKVVSTLWINHQQLTKLLIFLHHCFRSTSAKNRSKINNIRGVIYLLLLKQRFGTSAITKKLF